jgi:hypothetical protein
LAATGAWAKTGLEIAEIERVRAAAESRPERALIRIKNSLKAVQFFRLNLLRFVRDSATERVD